MKPNRVKNITIGTSSSECPACRYKRQTIKGVYVDHLLRSSLWVDGKGKTRGVRCGYSGARAVRTVSYSESRE